MSYMCKTFGQATALGGVEPYGPPGRSVAGRRPSRCTALERHALPAHRTGGGGRRGPSTAVPVQVCRPQRAATEGARGAWPPPRCGTAAAPSAVRPAVPVKSAAPRPP